MSWPMTSSGSRWRMTFRATLALSVLLVGSLAASACADFERGERPPQEPDATVVADSGPGDVGGGDETGDLGFDGVADVPADAAPDSAGELPPDVVVGEYSFASDIHGLLVKRCGDCHTSGAPRAFFLTSDPSTDYPGVLKLVKKATPASSKLLLKGTAEDQHGGGAVLSAGTADYDAILGWVAEGAFP